MEICYEVNIYLLQLRVCCLANRERELGTCYRWIGRYPLTSWVPPLYFFRYHDVYSEVSHCSTRKDWVDYICLSCCQTLTCLTGAHIGETRESLQVFQFRCSHNHLQSQ